MNLQPKKATKINPRKIQQSYMQRVEKEVEEQGVVLFDPSNGTLNISEEYLTLPQELTDIPAKELGEYLNAFTQNKMYMRTLYGRAKLLAEEAKRGYLEASHVHYMELAHSKLSETAKERIINGNEEVVEYYNEYTDTLRKLELLELAICNMEDAIFLLSREVTRRSGDFSDENRNHNVGRR